MAKVKIEPKEETLYRIYDPKEKKFIKSILVTHNYSYIRVSHTKLANSVFTESGISNIYKIKIELGILIDSKVQELKHCNDPKKRECINIGISNAQEVYSTLSSAKIQECKIIESTHTYNPTDETKQKMLEKITRKELEKCYSYNIVHFFLKHMRALARKTKKPVSEPFCIVPYDRFANNITSVWNYFDQIKDLGISYKRVDTWSKDLIFYNEEDYNLFKLTITEAVKLENIIYFKDIKEKYQEIQTSISQQMENSF